MKKVILLITVIVSLLGFKGFSQSFPDPEISERPYILGSDSSLKNFERPDALYMQRVKGFGGYGGNEKYYEVASPKSEIVFSKNAIPKIIIKVTGNIDVTEQLFLCKGEVKKKRRVFVTIAHSFVNQKKDISNSNIKLEFRKIKDGIFEIILPNNIESGEYAFLPLFSMENINAQKKISCFGIN